MELNFPSVKSWSCINCKESLKPVLAKIFRLRKVDLLLEGTKIIGMLVSIVRVVS
jgi:hypothetical protein